MSPDLNTLSMDLTGMLLPWIAVLLSLVVAIWFKDFAIGLAKGLRFKFDPAFNEGDECLLDGELAMIVKIGARQTVFGVYSERGYTWRYVPNERISSLKLERIVFNHKPNENEMMIQENQTTIPTML